ncbi:MAG: hypothetical protein WCK15_04950 [Pirellula sp.]
MMHLTWTPNASASALHAAESICLYGSKLTDRRVTDAIGVYAHDLGNWIGKSASFEPARFWSILIGHASIIDSNLDLAQAVVRKSALRLTNETAVTQLAGFVTDIEAAYNQLFPKFMEQVPLRARPLQEHWLGHGSGLIAHLGRLTQKSLIAEQARIVLLQPVLGGAGTAHIDQNMIRIEAVLTNPMVELPEVVRLAWLLSQLNLDLPMHADFAGASKIGRLAPLAMLPAILAAAEVMELSKCDESMAELAIEHWHIPVPRDKEIHTEVVPLMMDWWETYLQTRPDWNMAMQAFAKMLGIQ